MMGALELFDVAGKVTVVTGGSGGIGFAISGGLASAGAIIAVHDTDNRAFAGCRRAVYEQLERFELIAHVPDLVLLRRS
ncbi:MAG: hypothetical protein ABSD56_01295 [Bryobacteraceae bacterium]